MGSTTIVVFVLDIVRADAAELGVRAVLVPDGEDAVFDED